MGDGKKRMRSWQLLREETDVVKDGGYQVEAQGEAGHWNFFVQLRAALQFGLWNQALEHHQMCPGDLE